MKITETDITLDLDELVVIARTYNRADLAEFRESDPATYMVGVWLGWLFARNPELAKFVSDITKIVIQRPPGWSPGEIITGEPGWHPIITIELDQFDQPLTTGKDGIVILPPRMRPGQTVGAAVAAVLNKVMGRSS